MLGHGLGRREPSNFDHVVKYPMRMALPTAPARVERTLDLPTQYVSHYDQGQEGACVGFSLSWMMSILNRQKYDARALYLKAQLIDEWGDTPPGEGTSVNAGCRILHTEGHWRLQKSRWWSAAKAVLGMEQGIAAYRWATSVDDVRTAIHAGIPITFGVNWYQNFFSPVYLNKEWWIGAQENNQPSVNGGTVRGVKALDNLGRVAGGHAICCYAASDRRQAVRFVNTWGYDYPRVWVPYAIIDRLIREGGEVALITDR
jgi:hypothetical protein